MTKKSVLSLLAFNAVINAILINLRILNIIDLSWWLVFLPTWYNISLVLSKIVSDARKQNKIIRQPAKNK